MWYARSERDGMGLRGIERVNEGGKEIIVVVEGGREGCKVR